MAEIFPEQFADLEPFSDWARPTEMARNEKRWSASMEESRQFYDVMIERVPAALQYLNQFPLEELDGPDRNLLDLCLALTECSATIEMYEEPQPKYVFPIQRFIPTHDNWKTHSGGGYA